MTEPAVESKIDKLITQLWKVADLRAREVISNVEQEALKAALFVEHEFTPTPATPGPAVGGPEVGTHVESNHP
jgi:hypothetical protein